MWLIWSVVALGAVELTARPWHKYIAPLLIPAWSALSIICLVKYHHLGALILAFLSVYHIVNLARLEIGSGGVNYRSNRYLPSSLWLSLMSLVAAALIKFWPQLGISSNAAFLTLAIISLLASLGVLGTVLYSRLRYGWTLSEPLASSNLPSISVLVPARNETDDLIDCLKSLIGSDYQKMEIIVLDDCSQTKRTPEIIRSFAGHGVTFLAGQPPPEDWLAKNYALNELAEAANGDILLFAGVDVRFGRSTIANLVSSVVTNKLDMLSLLPANDFQPGIEGYLLQPLRYAWELALPRTKKQPAVLSTGWLIKKAALKKLGGFKAVKHKITPETYLAARTSRYAFKITAAETDLSSHKPTTSQYETAVRKRYPQLNRRIELAAGLSLAILLVSLSPIWLTLVGLASKYPALYLVALAALVINLISYALIVSLTYRRFLVLSLLMQPVAALYDLYLINYSLYKYEFSEVLWKGRNACLPLMQVIASLPRG